VRVRSLIVLPLLGWLPLIRETPRSVPPTLPGYVVDITAGDFFLEAPDTIPAGLTTLRLRVIKGDHMAILVRMDSGHTAADLLRARREGHPRPGWMHFVGGPGFPSPHGFANATMMLAPGQYILMCDVRAADGVYHFEKGMFRPLIVRQRRGIAQPTPLPSADAVVKMRDFSFAFSRPLRAGTRVLHVVNEGTVMHEFRLTRVLPGHTAREALAWDPAGKLPRPDEDVTALVGILPGHDLATTVKFTSGDYLVFCVAQIEHGMLQSLHVAAEAAPNHEN
jgi:hypothetical protein